MERQVFARRIGLVDIHGQERKLNLQGSAAPDGLGKRIEEMLYWRVCLEGTHLQRATHAADLRRAVRARAVYARGTAEEKASPVEE